MASSARPAKLFFLFCCGAAAACLLFFSVFGCGDLESGDVASILVGSTATTVGVNHTASFSAVCKDSSGRIVSTGVTWSVEGGIGSISSGGLFTAGAAEGTGYVVASAGSVSGRLAVTITAKGWVKGRVSASDSSIPSGLKVYLEEISTAVAFTNSSGNYSLDNIPAGTYQLKTIETTIYQATSNEVSVDSGETVTQNIFVTVRPDAPTIPTTTIPVF